MDRAGTQKQGKTTPKPLKNKFKPQETTDTKIETHGFEASSFYLGAGTQKQQENSGNHTKTIEKLVKLPETRDTKIETHGFEGSSFYLGAGTLKQQEKTGNLTKPLNKSLNYRKPETPR